MPARVLCRRQRRTFQPARFIWGRQPPTATMSIMPGASPAATGRRRLIDIENMIGPSATKTSRCARRICSGGDLYAITAPFTGRQRRYQRRRQWIHYERHYSSRRPSSMISSVSSGFWVIADAINQAVAHYIPPGTSSCWSNGRRAAPSTAIARSKSERIFTAPSPMRRPWAGSSSSRRAMYLDLDNAAGATSFSAPRAISMRSWSARERAPTGRAASFRGNASSPPGYRSGAIERRHWPTATVVVGDR